MHIFETARQADSIVGLIESAETAPPVTVRFAGGGSPDHRQVQAAPPPMATVSLSRELIPFAKAQADTGVSYGGLTPTKVGEIVSISTDVMRESRFCSAGGMLIVNSPAPRQLTDSNGESYFYDSPRQFHVVEPLPFTKLRPEPEASVSAWPVTGIDDQMIESLPSSALMATHSARVRLTRRQQRHLPRELWAFELAKAVSRGLARLVDQEVFGVLQDKLAATAWAWSWPAGKDLRHEELRAVIGTGGIGAQVRADGALTYGGACLAELTPTVAATLVGAFSRAAVFVRDDVQLIAKHMGMSGDLEVTVIASLRVAIPDLSYFTRPAA